MTSRRPVEKKALNHVEAITRGSNSYLESALSTTGMPFPLPAWHTDNRREEAIGKR
jgi:hypothetical protein